VGSLGFDLNATHQKHVDVVENSASTTSTSTP
jgi:hypothetical protein